MAKEIMKRLLIAAVVLFILLMQSVYAMDSNSAELMDELSIYITNEAEHPAYVQYYVGPSWDSASSKGSQSVPAGAVNLLAKDGVTCYAEIGDAGLSKNQGNVITVNVYDDASPERKLLGNCKEIVQHWYSKDITRDKGNYCHVKISKDDKVTARHVQLFTGIDDRDSNLGRAAAHYELIRVRAIQGAILIGLISLFLFFKSMKNGMMIGSKISKLGLLFFIINSLVVITFCVIDTTDAIETSSSGFALLPILMIDTPAMFIAMPVMSFISNVTLTLVPLSNNTLYVIVQKSIFAVSFLIFGGLQWYGIGWLISKLIKRFSPASK